MYEEWLEENGYNPDICYTEEELRALNEELLLEMAHFPKNKTGLPYDVWLDPAGKDRGNEHSNTPRLKILLPDKGWVPVLISDDPKIPDSVQKVNSYNIPNFNAIKRWIVAYKKILIAHYLRQIGDDVVYRLVSTTGKAGDAIEIFDDITLPRNNGKIEYYLDQNEGIYQIDVKDENGKVVTSSYAFSKYDAWKETQELKNIYEIEDENIKYLGEK